MRTLPRLRVLVLAVAAAASLALAGDGAAQETGTIRGRVTASNTMRPLAGVQVSVPGLGRGSLTNNAGEFLLPNIPAGTHTVRVQMIGYANAEQTATVAGGETVQLEFTLAEQVLALDEVVVTGAVGGARRREIGNSISAVSAEQLERETIITTQDAITGNTPGVQIQANGGEPGAGSAVRIRGVNSLTQGNRPLLYIDGVRMDNRPYPNTMSQQRSDPMNDINPADIERIEVIKGAAATTLYGTEASGGVIQIFTKRGRTGVPQWTFETTQGMTRMPYIGPKPSAEYIEFWRNDSRINPERNDPEGLWMHQWLETGHQQNYNLSVRGGTDGAGGVNYFVSGGWSDNTGNLPRQESSQGNLRGNITFSPTQAINIQFTNSVSQRDIFWLPLGNLAKSFTLNVFRGPFDYASDDDTIYLNEFDTRETQTHYVSGLEVGWAPTQSLSAKLNFGLDYMNSDYRRFEEFGSRLEPGGIRYQQSWNTQTRTVDFNTTYRHNLGAISTATSAGAQLYSNNFLNFNATARNFAGPGSPTINTGSNQVGSEERLLQTNAGFFLQELIGFRDKLFLTVGARFDGNSAFGEDYGLQAYPKASLSYVISDEAFWPAQLENAKLRFAYGESGKAPGHFDAQKTWAPVPSLGGQPGVSPSTAGNPNLGPERTSELEAGFEVSTFEGRLSVDFSAYRQTTDDALINVPQDPSLGFLDAQVANVGSFENSGIEVSGNLGLLRTQRVSWDLGGTASFTRSKVLDLGPSEEIFLGGELEPGMFARVGYPLPAYWGPVVANPNEFANPRLEEQYIGPMYPTRMIGVNTSLDVGRNLSFTARAEHQGGHYQLSHTAWRNVQRRVWPPCHDVARLVDTGRLGEVNAYDRWTCGPGALTGWAAYISPLDFVKLRSVQVNYRLPEGFLGGRLGRMDLALGGRNLWTSTDYAGVDPEANENGDVLTRHEYYQMPIPRTFTFTVRTNF
jgi:TonB-dependent starch-binding outer membrane protein SusC